MSHRKEWKKSQITREQFNHELYELLAEGLAKFKSDPPHKKYNDARLVSREILDNLYKHNVTAFAIGLEVRINSSNEVTIRITHDGNQFDPFDTNNECILIHQLDREYKFNSKFVASDSGRYSLILKINFNDVVSTTLEA